MRGQGDPSLYYSKDVEHLAAVFAQAAHVPVTAVHVQISAGSVLITVTIATGDEQSATEVVGYLMPLVSTGATATTFLSTAAGLSITSILTRILTLLELPEPALPASPHVFLSTLRGFVRVVVITVDEPPVVSSLGAAFSSGVETGVPHTPSHSSPIATIVLLAILGTLGVIGTGLAARFMRRKRHERYVRQIDNALGTRGLSEIVASPLHSMDLSQDIQLSTTLPSVAGQRAAEPS